MYNGFSAHSNTCSQHYAPIRKQEVNAQQAETQKFRQKWLETNSNGATSSVSSQSVNNNPQQSSNYLSATNNLNSTMPNVSNYTTKSTTLNHTPQSAQYYYDAIKKQPPSNDYSINAAGQNHNHHQYYDSTSSNNQQIRSITPVSGNNATPPPPVPQMSKQNNDVNIVYQKSTNQVPQPPQHPVKSSTTCQQIKAEPPQSQNYSNSQFSQANNRIFQYHQQTPYYSTTQQQSSQYNSSSDNLNYNRNQTNSPTFNNTNTNTNSSIGDVNKDSSNSSISPKTSLSQFAVKKQVSLSSLNQSPLTNGFPTQSQQQQYPSYVNCYQSPPAQTNHTPLCPPNPSPQSLSGSSTSSTPVPTSLLSQQQHLTPPRDQLAPPSTSSSSSSNNNNVQEMFQVVETSSSSSTSSNLICKSIFTETNLEELFYIYPAVHELILSQTMMGSSIEQIVQELKASLEQHQKQQQHFSIRT